MQYLFVPEYRIDYHAVYNYRDYESGGVGGVHQSVWIISRCSQMMGVRRERGDMMSMRVLASRQKFDSYS